VPEILPQSNLTNRLFHLLALDARSSEMSKIKREKIFCNGVLGIITVESSYRLITNTHWSRKHEINCTGKRSVLNRKLTTLLDLRVLKVRSFSSRM